MVKMQISRLIPIGPGCLSNGDSKNVHCKKYHLLPNNFSHFREAWTYRIKSGIKGP